VLKFLLAQGPLPGSIRGTSPVGDSSFGAIHASIIKRFIAALTITFVPTIERRLGNTQLSTRTPDRQGRVLNQINDPALFRRDGI
jgi:hypothetical protein